MGSNDSTITLSIVARDLASGQIGKAVAGLDALAKKGGLVGAMAQGVGQKFGQMLNPVSLATQGFGMLQGALQGAGEFLGNAAQAAIDEQVNIAQLGAALRANVANWDGNTAAIEAQIKKNEEMAFSDDDLRTSLAQLVASTHDVNRSLDGQSLAMDIARGRTMSFSEATSLVAKTMAGNYTRAFKAAGLSLDGITNKEQALAFLNKTYAGQAEAYAKTMKGQLETLNIELQDVNENIGAHLLPSMQKVATFAKSDLMPAIEGAGDALGGLIDLVTMNLTPGEGITILDFIPGAVRDLIPGANAAAVELGKAVVNGVKQEVATLPALALGGVEADVADAMGGAGTVGADSFINSLTSGIDAGHRAITDAAGSAGADAMRAVATGMKQSEGNVHDEWKQFVKDLNHPFDAMKEIAFLNGKLTGHRLAEGLASSDPITKANAETMRDHILAQLDDLKALGYDIGDGVGPAVATGINHSESKAVTQAGQLVDAVNRKLDNIKSNINIGVHYSTSSTGGINPATGRPWGARQHGGRGWPGESLLIGEFGRPELFTPDSHGYISPRVQSSGPGGGLTVNVAFQTLTPPTASQGQAMAQAFVPELVREMRRQRIL